MLLDDVVLQLLRVLLHKVARKEWVVKGEADTLGEQRLKLRNHLFAQLALCHNRAQRQRKPRLLLPQSTQVGNECKVATLIDKSPLRTDIVKGTDFMCIRELTGGLYFGRPQGRSEDGNVAYDTCVSSREEIERIVKLAYEYAMKRRKKVTVIDKANVLATSRLWRETAKEIAAQYPEVETEFMFVDNAAMRLIQWPTSFDVMVTENMFGDILTDEGSVITGSLGLLPSASVGVHTSLFEPIHGSWPQAAGKNIANPLATILSAAMMFEYAFGLMEEGKLIREAVSASMAANVRTPDIQVEGGKEYGTKEVGEWIVNYINNK